MEQCEGDQRKNEKMKKEFTIHEKEKKNSIERKEKNDKFKNIYEQSHVKERPENKNEFYETERISKEYFANKMNVHSKREKAQNGKMKTQEHSKVCEEEDCNKAKHDIKKEEMHVRKSRWDKIKHTENTIDLITDKENVNENIRKKRRFIVTPDYESNRINEFGETIKKHRNKEKNVSREYEASNKESNTLEENSLNKKEEKKHCMRSGSLDDNSFYTLLTQTGCRHVKNYNILNIISEGTYGTVYIAECNQTKEKVALKKLKNFSIESHDGFPCYSLREIILLFMSKHENIIRLKEVVVGNQLNEVYLVLEYIQHELGYLINCTTFNFSMSEIKCLLKQLLSGVHYLHSNFIMHRDLKTSNLLYTNEGILKICDFGLARKFKEPEEENRTNNVVTLWYRAPEILLGNSMYTSKIDLWSIGCIFAELILKKPLFIGKDRTSQLLAILNILGLPDKNKYPDFFKYKSINKQMKYFKENNIQMNVSHIRSHFPTVANQFSGGFLSNKGFDLLERLLSIDPSQRISAVEALEHPYFEEYPKTANLENMPKLPDSNLRRDPRKKNGNTEEEAGENSCFASEDGKEEKTIK